MSAPVRLDEASIEAVAQRVVEMLSTDSAEASKRPADSAGETKGKPALLDTAATAERFAVSTEYLYAHADRLGAKRLGDGPKARLRFDPTVVEERLAADRPAQSAPTGADRRTRKRCRKQAAVDLLPVRGSDR